MRCGGLELAYPCPGGSRQDQETNPALAESTQRSWVDPDLGVRWWGMCSTGVKSRTVTSSSGSGKKQEVSSSVASKGVTVASKLQCAGGAIFRSKKLPPWVPRQARWHGLLSYTFLTFCECVKAMSHVKHLSSQFASSRYVSAEPEFPTLVGVEVQRNINAYPSLTYVNGRILAWPLQVGGRASKHSFHPFHPVLVDFVSSKAQTSKEILW